MNGDTKNVYLNGILYGEVKVTNDIDVDLGRVRALLAEKGVDMSPPAEEGLRRQAVHFMRAANHLFQLAGIDGEQPLRDPSAAIVFVVNAAFSAELFLKSLRQADGAEFKKIHGLLSIYDELSEGMRVHIDVCASHLARALQFAELPAIRETIETIDSAFVEWRYAHERERTGVVVGNSVGFLLETLNIATQSGVGAIT